MDIKKIINTSSLTEKSKLQIITIYDKITKAFLKYEKEELGEIIKEENLLAQVESFIQSIADNTLGKFLVSELFPKKIQNTEEITSLSIRISRYEGWLNLYKFESEENYDDIGDVTVDCLEQIGCSEALNEAGENGNYLIEDLLDDIDKLLEICLKEYLSLEKLIGWEIKQPIPIYYSSNYEEQWDDAHEGVLITTLQ
ncbi:hypothetical protein H0I31_09030 [Tenacibaculum sp. AHE15PA]|uniref:hypothetical protein n=1 Tax=unclassified Tenacibaculum TaxID=2635139 RepID=UPI001C4F0434|nr:MULTISPECIES: hypothetical protein [unclassified Tenacibaculum]QXP74308.1 hypothetical protein H0I30_03940 [Tenacibaculum sp. AHE14PA]QXP75322.1 hypothetical protein H0I31_09030 [Tenacibaculum sp. AHE15PA]